LDRRAVRRLAFSQTVPVDQSLYRLPADGSVRLAGWAAAKGSPRIPARFDERPRGTQGAATGRSGPGPGRVQGRHLAVGKLPAGAERGAGGQRMADAPADDGVFPAAPVLLGGNAVFRLPQGVSRAAGAYLAYVP